MQIGRLACALCMATTFFSPWVYAEEPSPVGMWQTIDDNSGKPRALVRLEEENKELRGTIVQIYAGPGEDPAPRCTKCSDARHDQPVVGMVFLNGLRREGATQVWSGGEILDPDSGSVYHSKATLSSDGKQLDVRGFVGIPLFGRSQTWKRAD